MIRLAARPLRALAVAALIGGTALIVPQAAYAADAGLRVVTRTTYTAVPAEKRVHVSVDATATNLTPDPPSGRYYYTDARFAVQPGIRNLTASAAGSTLIGRIVSATQEFTSIDVAFGRSLFHGDNLTFGFSFDIVDPGGAPQRDVRVANTLVAFPVWAFGSSATPGSSVRVVIPTGYTVSVVAGSIASSRQSDGTTLLTASAIPDPTEFFAYVTAERPGAFRQTHATIALPERTVYVDIRAWNDDPEWGDHEEALIAKGLPVLRQLIGLPYLVRADLTIEEAAIARLGDYAGVYDPVSEEMHVRYDADDYVTLHEASHTWFNNNLFTDRWIGEAWAEYYAVQAGKRIGANGQVFVLTPQLRKSAIALNAWGAVGQEPQTTEDYAYAATYTLAGLIAQRATIPGLQKVWIAAHDDQGAYQPVHAAEPEIVPGKRVAGWQELLDLLEERTGRDYDDLWRSWVITPDQRALMDLRSATRSEYRETLAKAGDWELPALVRFDMSSWQFDDASSQLDRVRAVLSDRDAIQTDAAQLGLRAPNKLQQEFEAATVLDAPATFARDELGALTAIGNATSAIDRDPSALEAIGLLFADPKAELGAARKAFEAGDPQASVGDAHAAKAERDAAADAGRLRVSVTGGVLLLLDGAAMGLLYRRRRSRTRRTLSTDPFATASPTGEEAPLA